MTAPESHPDRLAAINDARAWAESYGVTADVYSPVARRFAVDEEAARDIWARANELVVGGISGPAEAYEWAATEMRVQFAEEVALMGGPGPLVEKLRYQGQPWCWHADMQHRVEVVQFVAEWVRDALNGRAGADLHAAWEALPSHLAIPVYARSAEVGAFVAAQQPDRATVIESMIREAMR